MNTTLVNEFLQLYRLCNDVWLLKCVVFWNHQRSNKTTLLKRSALLGIIVGFLFGKLCTSLVCSSSSTLKSGSSKNDLPAKSGQPTAVQYTLARCHELRWWIRMKKEGRIPRQEYRRAFPPSRVMASFHNHLRKLNLLDGFSGLKHHLIRTSCLENRKRQCCKK